MSEDSEWIYDSVVGFLNSPIWSVPIESFIDDNCLVFEETSEDHEGYHGIHNEYRLLVEELLESFTNDLNITPTQFIEGCEKVKTARGSYTKGIFEYVFASVNFELFKRIMTRHNVALSLQALQMLRGGSAEGADDLEQEVLKFSEKEFAQRQEDVSARTEKEIADLEASLLKSRIDCETLLKDIERDKETLLSKKTTNDEGVKDPVAPPVPTVIVPAADVHTPTSTTQHLPNKNEPDNKKESVKSLPPLVVRGNQNVHNDAAQKWLEDAKNESSAGPATPIQGDNKMETLEERKRYWLERKQSLIAQKKSQGLTILSQHGPQGATERPSSARVARNVVENKVRSTPATTSEAVPAKAPAMSQALADALRREVIKK